MSYNGIVIKSLKFSGVSVKLVDLDFGMGTNLVYGASNTGKSLALKAIDFMLGSSTILPDVDERDGYDTVWLDFEISGETPKKYSISRSISGGAYKLYDGINIGDQDKKLLKTLAASHDSTNDDNISTFFLEKIGMKGRRIAKNQDGETENLTFRGLANIQLVDEKAIQDEVSPVETGHRTTKTKERRIFRTLISGQDDSSIVPVVSSKKFNNVKGGKVEILEEMISSIDIKIKKIDFEIGSLSELFEILVASEKTTKSLNKEIEKTQAPLKELITNKKNLASSLSKINSRLEQVNMHLDRFAKLYEVYDSDIERLQSIEESGFLLSVGGGRECPLCGASSENQSHKKSINEVSNVQLAALAEIDKIKKMKIDLKKVIVELKKERDELYQTEAVKELALSNLEEEIISTVPDISILQEKIDDEYASRDNIKNIINLFERRSEYAGKLSEIRLAKAPPKKDKPELVVSAACTQELCGDISTVLEAWQFPGNKSVTFDEETYDIKIDGKLRTNNGKGVRAVTHAAFKVALLIYCRRKGLPHPGFLILDTPLLTFRDPMTSKYGELSGDEAVLAETTLKDNFFSHINSLSHLGQFIIFENMNPPENVIGFSKIYEFTKTKSLGRYGLFPK